MHAVDCRRALMHSHMPKAFVFCCMVLIQNSQNYINKKTSPFNNLNLNIYGRKRRSQGKCSTTTCCKIYPHGCALPFYAMDYPCMISFLWLGCGGKKLSRKGSAHFKRDWWNSGVKQEFSQHKARILPALSWKSWKNRVFPSIKQGFSQH